MNMLGEQFFIGHFIFGILIAIIGLFLCILMIISIVVHRPCHTVTNILICNTTIWIASFQLSILLGSVYGFRTERLKYQPFCILQAIHIVFSICGISLSYAFQAISRLFFAIFYKHRFLLTFRVHWYLIILNWTISLSLPVTALLIPNAYVFVEEMRICMINTNIFRSLTYLFASGFLIPFTIVIAIYCQILYRTHQSNRRIHHSTQPSVKYSVPNAKRQMKLVQNILLCLGIYGIAGIPWIMIFLWKTIVSDTSPPEAIYLPALIGLSISATVMISFLLAINREVKEVVLRILLRFHHHVRHPFNRTRHLPISAIRLS